MATPAQGNRLVKQRRRLARRAVIAALSSSTIVLNDEEVQGGDAAVGAEAHSGSPRHVGAGMPDVVLVLPTDAHHDGRVGLLREQRRDAHRHRAAALGAKPTARVLGDEHDVFRIHTDPTRDQGMCAHRALGGSVQEQLAVLPVRQRAASLERLVAGCLDDERFVDRGHRENGFFFEARLVREGRNVPARRLGQAGRTPPPVSATWTAHI